MSKQKFAVDISKTSQPSLSYSNQTRLELIDSTNKSLLQMLSRSYLSAVKRFKSEIEDKQLSPPLRLFAHSTANPKHNVGGSCQSQTRPGQRCERFVIWHAKITMATNICCREKCLRCKCQRTEAVESAVYTEINCQLL